MQENPPTLLNSFTSSQVCEVFAQSQIPIQREAFTDRLYLESGALCDRSESRAVHKTVDKIIQQTMSIVEQQRVSTLSDTFIEVVAETICLHGDNPISVQAVEHVARIVRDAV